MFTMKIALAQINTTVGDLAGNVDLMVRSARDAASAGAGVVVFPELSIIGYPPKDLLLREGRVAAIGQEATAKAPAGIERFDATGLIVTPGLIDLHVHLREPGQSAKETIATGTAAAARGGFTSIVCMPNTSPVIENAGTVALI